MALLSGDQVTKNSDHCEPSALETASTSLSSAQEMGAFVPGRLISHDLIPRYTKLRCAGLRGNYVRQASMVVTRFVNWVSEKPDANLVDLYLEYANYLHSTLSKPSYSCYMKHVKAFLKWSYAMGIIDKNPVDLAKIPVGGTSVVTRKVISNEGYRKLKEACGSKNYLRELFITGRHTGMSISDSCTIEWGHIDIDNMFIIKPRLKNGIVARVPILAGGEFYQYIMDQRREDPLDPGWPNDPDNNRYYLNPMLAAWYLKDRKSGSSEYWDEESAPETSGPNLCSTVSRVFKRAGLPKNSFHDFRRSMATLFSNTPGVSIDSALKIMGWKTHEMLYRYSQPISGELHEAFRAAMEKRDKEDESGSNDWVLQVPGVRPTEYQEDQDDIESEDSDISERRQIPADTEDREDGP